jgi:hypothetical protein
MFLAIRIRIFSYMVKERVSCPCEQLIWHGAVKMYEGSEGQLPSFLNSALDGGEWSASRPGPFTSGESASGTYLTGEWVGSRAGLDALEKREIFAPARNRTPAVHPVACRCLGVCEEVKRAVIHSCL